MLRLRVPVMPVRGDLRVVFFLPDRVEGVDEVRTLLVPLLEEREKHSVSSLNKEHTNIDNTPIHKLLQIIYPVRVYLLQQNVRIN